MDAIPELIPRMPERFRPTWLDSSGLAASLEYTEYAAGPDRFWEEAGLPREFLKDLSDSNCECPSWLRSLCIRFAKEDEDSGGLGWSDKTGWPEFLQTQ